MKRTTKGVTRMSISTPVQEFTQEELATILGFEPDEVKLNSIGKYSERQKKGLHSLARVFLMSISFFTFCNLLFVMSSNNPKIILNTNYAFLLVINMIIFAQLPLVLRTTTRKPTIKTCTGLMTTKTKGVMRFPPIFFVKEMAFNVGSFRKYLRNSTDNIEGYIKLYYFQLTPFTAREVLSAEPWFDEPETEA
jgi:hypothetical protein